MRRKRSRVALLIAISAVALLILGFVLYKTNPILFWSYYKDPKRNFSLRYPRNWYYEPFGYTIPDTWLPVTQGVYPTSKENLEKAAKKLDKINSLRITYYREKISDFMPKDYEIVDSKDDFFGTTKVITNRYCLKAGTIAKGNLPVKANTMCENHSLINIGGVGTMEVDLSPLANANKEEIDIYKKILSTIKYIN